MPMPNSFVDTTFHLVEILSHTICKFTRQTQFYFKEYILQDTKVQRSVIKLWRNGRKRARIGEPNMDCRYFIDISPNLEN